MAQTQSKTQEALIQARAAAQELHGALSDAASKARGAVTADLEAAQKHAMKGAKSVGQVLQDSVRKTLAEARNTAQHISEALAEERSASAPKRKN